MPSGLPCSSLEVPSLWHINPDTFSYSPFLTFSYSYGFPAEHWVHIRTTNPIESTFATVRLRHRRTKGSGSRKACLAMVFKLMESASKKWRVLNGSALIPEVIAGIQFVDGVRKNAA